MKHPSPTPFDALDAASEELGVPLLLDRLASQDAALSSIERIAAEECGQQPATTSAMKACDLLHHAAREREELGYMPPDTVNDAVRLARTARSHVQRVRDLRAQTKEPGR